MTMLEMESDMTNCFLVHKYGKEKKYYNILLIYRNIGEACLSNCQRLNITGHWQF